MIYEFLSFDPFKVHEADVRADLMKVELYDMFSGAVKYCLNNVCENAECKNIGKGQSESKGVTCQKCSTCYCSKECMESHIEKHTVDCNVRDAIYRVASVCKDTTYEDNCILSKVRMIILDLCKLFPDTIKIFREVCEKYARENRVPVESISLVIDINRMKYPMSKTHGFVTEFMLGAYTGTLPISVSTLGVYTRSIIEGSKIVSISLTKEIGKDCCQVIKHFCTIGLV